MKLGEKLYNLRIAKNLSQEQVALELQVSKTALIKWEQNKAKPSIDNIVKICDFYETDFYSLLEDVSNVNFSHAKFKGTNYVVNPNNSTINFNNSPEIVQMLLDNQKQITGLVAQQSELFEKLLKK